VASEKVKLYFSVRYFIPKTKIANTTTPFFRIFEKYKFQNLGKIPQNLLIFSFKKQSYSLVYCNKSTTESLLRVKTIFLKTLPWKNVKKKFSSSKIENGG
jgi:hypothetical protein